MAEQAKFARLLETEKLVEKHDGLKKEFKKKLQHIKERSHHLVFEQVKRDKLYQQKKSIGTGFSAAGSGIAFLGATLIPFVPPVGAAIAAFGSGVSVVGYIILGVNRYWKIKGKRGKGKQAKQEFDKFYEDMKQIVDKYDKSSTVILDELSTYPEIRECTNFEQQLDILNELIEKYNKRNDRHAFPLTGLHSLVNTLMKKDKELMEDENTKMTMEKIVEDTKRQLKEAFDEAAHKQEEADSQPEKEPKNKHWMATVAGPSFAVAKPVMEQSYLMNPQQLIGVKNMGVGISDIVTKSMTASNTTTGNVAAHTAIFGLEYGSVVFGAATSFISMCLNGRQSWQAFKKYKALDELTEKAKQAGDYTDQLTVLMENEKYEKLAKKAITIIELTDAMTELLDHAI